MKAGQLISLRVMLQVNNRINDSLIIRLLIIRLLIKFEKAKTRVLKLPFEIECFVVNRSQKAAFEFQNDIVCPRLSYLSFLSVLCQIVFVRRIQAQLRMHRQ